MSFTDLFSSQASDYVRHRPTYPDDLYRFVASQVSTHAVAWDCATGNGQAAHGLRGHFERVIATDGSAQQIEHAIPGDGIDYHVATAYDSGIEESSVNAITVATALHWFELPPFYDEVRRVAADGAVLAVWTYANSQFPAGIDEVVAEFVNEPLRGHWSPKISNAWNGYANLDFPFDEIEPPPFEIRRQWRAVDFANYVRTWSAAQSFEQAAGHEVFAHTFDAFAAAWGEQPIEVVWPLDVRVGRVGRMFHG